MISARRNVLKMVAAVPLIAGGVKAAEERFDLQTWLDTADQNDVAEYHAAKLREVMSALVPSLKWKSTIDKQYGFAIIHGN